MTATATRRRYVYTTAPAVQLSLIENTLGLSVSAARERLVRLTPREAEVARMMASGQRNRQIAADLGISSKTLDIHRANLMHKLQVRTAAGVANLVNLLRLAEAAD
jgi:FixJ family two-component response regulator